MGCSMACDMLLTASTAIASPGAAILLRSNFEGESDAAAAANLDDEVKAEPQNIATTSRRATGRKSKRNDSEEADSQNVAPVAGAKDHDLSTDMIAEAETEAEAEADNTAHRGKRSRTVKTETSIPASARGVKRSAGSAQSSQVKNESEGQDQHAAAPIGGKKTALEGTEKLSTPCESQPTHTGNRVDHDEKDDKIQKDSENPVRIINTGLLYGDEEFEELARACGAVVSALPSNATHIVTTDTLKRTPKV